VLLSWIHTYLPTQEQFALRNKAQLAKVASSFGVSTPQTITVFSIKELQEATDKLGFPLMIKGCYYKAYQISNDREAQQRFHQLAAECGYPIIVQTIVKGIELNLVGIGDGEGSHLGLVAVRKTSVTELGKIWSAVTIHHAGLLKAAEAFLQHTRWQGPFELECIADNNRTIYLIEINPRFPAWTYFATGVGINLPARLVRKALGLPLPPLCSYDAGKLLMRYTYEIVTDTTPLQTLVTSGEL
jgi:carbamoyl-phosphate synthase large subunit